jgi:hypothetical protein
MAIYEFPQLSEEVQRTSQKTMWLVNDGAPTRFTRDLKQFIDYVEEWEGRIGSVLWALRSPDPTPLGPSRDTFYWKTVNRRNEFGV